MRLILPRQINFISALSVLIFLIFCTIQTIAQPSGGPYGPIQQTYKLPQVSGTIYYVAPDGKADQSGETLSNPTTLENAISLVKNGDAIVLRGGTYRTGGLVLNQQVTIQPYKDEQPVLKGTYVASNWQNLGHGLWATSWSHFFPSKPQSWWFRRRESRTCPLYRFNNDMVFVNGKFLQAVGWAGEVNENTYYIDYEDSTVYIGVDPTDKLVEITAFNSALIITSKEAHNKVSNHKGPTINGITFTQYAYRAIEIEGKDAVGLDPEQNHGKDVVGTTFDNCTISYCSRVAGYFRGDHLTIRHCKISDTSTEGVYIISSSNVLLEKNIFTRNNIERITGYYPAAVKIFDQCYHVTVKDNLIINLPYSNGVWFDVGNVEGRFIDNWVQNVGNINDRYPVERLWPARNGFFFEISKGAICAGNVFVNCDHGSMALNSSNVHFYNNTYINSSACIARTARSAKNDHFGWHPSTGPDIQGRVGHMFVNNLMVGDKIFYRPFLYVWQPDTVCGMVTEPQLKELDHNIYIRHVDNGQDPLILWSSGKKENCKTYILKSLEGLQEFHPDFSLHSKFYSNYNGLLFKGKEVNNYHLLKAFSGSEAGTTLPSEISKLIGEKGNYVGAFPPIEQ